MQGTITKTGNTHVRRLLVEAAWHHRPRYHVGAVMRSRWNLAPQLPGPVEIRATAACMAGGWDFWNAASDPWRPMWRSRVSLPAGAGRWR